MLNLTRLVGLDCKAAEIEHGFEWCLDSNGDKEPVEIVTISFIEDLPNYEEKTLSQIQIPLSELKKIQEFCGQFL